MVGRRRLVLLTQRDSLLARIATASDRTARAVPAKLPERGIEVSYGAVWSFLAAEGLTFKNLRAGRQRPDVVLKAHCPEAASGPDRSGPAVFVDETWARTNDPQL